jgi:hypothetical protein
VKARTKFLAVVAVALTPIVASYVLYFAVRDSSPWATTNQGELLDPPRAVRELAWVDARNRNAVALGDTHWWLLVVAENGCATACDEALAQLRALHVLLNRDAGRVRRALVLDTAPSEASLSTLDSRFPKLAVLIAPSPPALSAGIYVVDPLGNVILRYPLDAGGKPVLADLKKLLRASQVG